MVAASDEDRSDPPDGAGPSKSGGAIEELKGLFSDQPKVQLTEDHVQSVLTVRRGREALFGRKLFSDPAWDVILELYAARLGDRRMSAPELARVIGLPASVIARWVSALVEAGVVERGPDETREPTLELTDDGAAKMARLVNQWSSAFFAI